MLMFKSLFKKTAKYLKRQIRLDVNVVKEFINKRNQLHRHETIAVFEIVFIRLFPTCCKETNQVSCAREEPAFVFQHALIR